MATSAVTVSKVAPKRVIAFRKRHGLTAEGMDELFGYGSKGRTTRLWESNGAPRYVGILMGYMDKFGIDEAKNMTISRKAS